jgi:hypothetical protein
MALIRTAYKHDELSWCGRHNFVQSAFRPVEGGQHMGRHLGSALTFLVTLLLMLLFGEFVVRWVLGDQTVLFPRYHTDVTYGDFTIRRIHPNARFRHRSVDGAWEFHTNSQGFRNYVDFEYEKPQGRLRVLSLGDSHTQGYEVRQDYTFSSVLERYLSKQGIDAEVMNTGVSGFGTAEQLILLENEGIRYQPDVVVLAFFANDVEDNIKSDLYRIDNEGNLFAASFRHTPGVRLQNVIYSVPGVKWLGENSYLYSVAFNLTWSIFKSRLSATARDEVIEYAIPMRDDYTPYEIALAASLLERIAEICESNEIFLVLVDIPVSLGSGGISSSFADDLRQSLPATANVVDSLELLSTYQGVAELHAPNGHHHISEFTHTLLGVQIGRLIEEALWRKDLAIP